MDDDNQFCVPTFGYYPVIIDFGFSYSKALENSPIYSSLAHTDVGFMTNQYDEISDAKLLLVSISEEIKRYRSNETSIKFRNIIRNIFSPLDIDWESGWDNYNIPGAADHIIEEMEKINTKSKLFDKYPHYCIDLIQTLITLPLIKLPKDNIKTSYKTMVNEFYKITNVPILLNTSFNLGGEPLVNSIHDAISTLTNCDGKFKIIYFPEIGKVYETNDFI